MGSWIIRLFILHVFLQLADGWLTFYGMSIYNAEELNPIMNLMMAEFGIVNGLILAKTTIVLLTAFAIRGLLKKAQPGELLFLYRVLIVMNIFYGGVVGWSIYQLLNY